MRVIWKNGIFLPETEAVQSMYDSGSMYGDSIFTMLRSFNKRTFRLEAHLDRLLDGIKYTEMPCAYNFHQLKMAHEDIINRNRFEFSDDDEYRTFINVSRGPLPIYSPILEPIPWVMITAYPLRWVLKGQSRFYRDGRSAVITPQRSIPNDSIENKVKNHCRLGSRLAELEAQRHNPFAYALLCDRDGFITEATGANFFIVVRDRLLTPEPRNCLRGISRNYVLSLARKLGIDYRERNVEPFDAITAEEAFFTATPWCITPCTSINGRKIGRGKVGEITTRLTEAWKEAVGCDFEEQSRRWDADAV